MLVPTWISTVPPERVWNWRLKQPPREVPESSSVSVQRDSPEFFLPLGQTAESKRIFARQENVAMSVGSGKMPTMRTETSILGTAGVSAGIWRRRLASGLSKTISGVPAMPIGSGARMPGKGEAQSAEVPSLSCVGLL